MKASQMRKKLGVSNNLILYILFLLIVFLLSGCPGNGNGGGDPKITQFQSDPANSIVLGETVDIIWAVENSSGYICVLTIDEEGPGGQTLETINCPGGSFDHTPPKAVNYRYTLQVGKAGEESKATDSFSIDVEPLPSVTITAVEILNNGGSNQVRQGGGLIQVVVTGNDLAGATAPKLVQSDITGTVDPANSTNTSIRINFEINHAVAIGEQTLEFSATAGKGTKTTAIEITPIVAAPSGTGTAKGTFDSPLTLSQARTIAESGDTIHLQDGEYFFSTDFIIPDGVTVEGESQAAIIKPVSITSNALGFGFENEAVVKTLTIDGFRSGLDADGTDKVTLDGVKVTKTTEQAIYTRDEANVTIRNSLFTGNNVEAIHVHGSSTLTIINTISTDNGGAGIKMHDENGPDDYKSVTIDGMTITGNDEAGMDIDTSSTHGIIKVRNTRIENNARDGILFRYSLDTIDFGTTSEPGGNTILNNGQDTTGDYWELHDIRAARIASDGSIISFIGNTIVDESFASDGVQTGPDFFELGSSKYWKIDNTNNRIKFSD